MVKVYILICYQAKYRYFKKKLLNIERSLGDKLNASYLLTFLTT